MDRRNVTSARLILRRKKIAQMSATNGLLSSATTVKSRITTARYRSAAGRSLPSGRRSVRKFNQNLRSLDSDINLNDRQSMSPYDVIPPLFTRKRPSSAGNTTSEIEDAIAQLKRDNTLLPVLTNGEMHPYPYFISEEGTLIVEQRPRSAPARQQNQWKSLKKAADRFRMDNKFAKGFIFDFVENIVLCEMIDEVACEILNTPVKVHHLQRKKVTRNVSEELHEQCIIQLYEDMIMEFVQFVVWSLIDETAGNKNIEQYRQKLSQINNQFLFNEQTKASIIAHQKTLWYSNKVKKDTHQHLKDISTAALVVRWYTIKNVAETMHNSAFKVVHSKVNDSEASTLLEAQLMKRINKEMGTVDSLEIRTTPPR